MASSTTRILLPCALAGALVAAAVTSVPAQNETRNPPAAKQQTRKTVPAKKPAHDGKPETPPARTPYSAGDEQLAIFPGFPDARAWGDSAADFQRLLPQTPGPWLILSGGGADGAYGAGLISGWSQTGDRPEFAVVTGVSTGAAIAPFAFLGPRRDEDLRKNFTTITAADVFTSGGTYEGLFDTWPLKRLIEKQVTNELLAEIAAEHRRGRRLLVVTTNLDSGRPVVWNMGAIADRGGEQALKLFHQVLLASSAIPGLFPPAYIDAEANGRKFQEMHADGTITGPFYVAPNSMLSPGPGAPRLPATGFYIVVNSKLSPYFQMPERERSYILSRGLGVALQFGLRAQVYQIHGAAQRLGIGYHLAFISPDFAFPGRGAFDPDYMKALFEHGVEVGKSRAAFRSTPPDFNP